MKKEAKDGEIARLKRKIQRLESDKKRLVSEVKDLRKNLAISHSQVTKKVKEQTLEEVLIENRKHIEQCDECGSSNISVVKYPSGKVTICKDCSHRKTVKHG